MTTIHWPAVRDSRGICPECYETPYGPERCLNFTNGGCDGRVLNYAYNVEMRCHESTRKAECFATGVCPSCHWHLCDAHGADPGEHESRCKLASAVGAKENA